MSLMLYSTVSQTNESILLNNKEFNPCAIIGTFQSEKPSEYPIKEVDMQPTKYPDRKEKVKEMFYKGNRLMLRLDSPVWQTGSSEPKNDKIETGDPGCFVRKACLLQKRLSGLGLV